MGRFFKKLYHTHYRDVLGMYCKRSELEIRVRTSMAVLCVRVHANQSFEPRNSDMVSEKVPFQVPVSEIRV